MNVFIDEVKFPSAMNLNDFTDTFFFTAVHGDVVDFFFFFILFEKIENVSTSVGDAMF